MSEKIKFQIEELDYQEQAVNSVIDLLKGIDRYAVSSIYSRKHNDFLSTHPESNVKFQAGARLIQNMQAVQFKNGLYKDDHIVSRIPQFTIEMETGTGKTFVYLETILKLWSEFGGQFKKFIIVVPSTAILLGVKKSIETFADYFKPKFNNIDLRDHFFIFDKNVSESTVSAKLIESNDLSIMLITNASFNKKGVNRLRKKSERDVVVWEDIKDIAPIIIIDEPQKIDGDGKKKTETLAAIEELAPPMILRYSATHKNLYNPVYKLDSYDAYKQKLVKGIRVKTIHSLTPKDFPYVRFMGVDKKTLKGKIEIFSRDGQNAIKRRKFDVENNVSLEELSGGLPQYHNWYISAQPRLKAPLQISTADGDVMYLDENDSNDNADPNAAVEKQIEIAIREHFRKQQQILESGRKIKVLTLFFVDSVEKVRGKNADGRGIYLEIFDRVYEKIRSEIDTVQHSLLQQYPKEFAILDHDVPVTKVREGYFAIDAKNKAVEVEGWNSSIDDENVNLKTKSQADVDRGIDLILNKKDELISFDEPLSFIFSHSALREGWDNPNVFVIVTFKEKGTDIAKKQEIGRGLRLPVDANGERCYDSYINELTVVANDYYDHFAEVLQKDYNDNIGFNREEVSADIIKTVVEMAGIPPEKAEQACDALKTELLAKKIVEIKKDGKVILTKEDSLKNFKDTVFTNPILAKHSIKIIESFVEVMQDKGSKKIEIVNGDEDAEPNDFQKYVSEAEFEKMYLKLLSILQKKSLYRYEFDKDKFIAAVSAAIESELKRKNDFIKFEISSADVDFSKSRKMEMGKALKQVEESTEYTQEYEHRPLFEIVNIIMMQTMLPRLAIIKIINNLSENSRRKLNNQDYLESAIKVIETTLAEFKSKKFLTAELIGGISATESKIFEVDKIPYYYSESEAEKLHIFTPKNKKALNLKYKLDSDGEYKFAKAIDDDPEVIMYTKLKKGGFIIETPVGEYSPDWAIVYKDPSDSNVKLYFIAETKWDKDKDGLTLDEKIKIKCATKHFEAVNASMQETVKYAWVNAYKDNTKAQSFPQIFVNDNYTDTLIEP